jgi:hypothetical protein
VAVKLKKQFVFGKFDSTQNELKLVEIDSFPTFILFNKKERIVYEKERVSADMIDFLME